MDVLVIEDDFDIRYILSYEISDMGFNPISFSSPLEAQAHLEQNSVDAVVCDYNLPSMDGIAFFTWMKSECLKVPFILLTGQPDLNAEDLINLGMKKVLYKPRQLTELKEVLSNISIGLLV